MENTLSWSPDAADVPKRRRQKRATKPRVLTRKDLDNRTAAARAFDKLYAAISTDLGGDLTAVERSLVEGFVGATVVLQALNTRLALVNRSIFPNTLPSAAAWCALPPRSGCPGARALSAA
jgi:hypothetical protein